jgi:sigma-B regulation protein RsbU (phosphoserine phosphatase)
MRRKIPAWLLIAVVVTLAGSWFFCGASLAGYVSLWRHRATVSNAPFRVKYTDRAEFVSKNFQQAGMAVGDRVLATNGVPFTGFLPAFAQWTGKHSRDPFSVTVEKPDGRVVTITAVPDAFFPAGGKQKASLLVLAVVLELVFPLACLIMATWVLTARPADPYAWLVFLLLQYPQTFLGLVEYFPGWIFLYMQVWTAVTQTLFVVAALLFGLTFPERLGIDRRYPWAKWLVIGPLLVLMPLDLFEVMAQAYRVSAMKLFPVALYHLVDKVESVLAIVCVSALCGGIFSQYFQAKTRDARRRMRVLLLGSQLGLWPTFIIVIIGAIRQVQTNEAVPGPIFVTALLMFMLFPLSLAYVIIVQRAMDVRLLVRQGTQYALARGTLRTVRLGLGAWLAYLIYEQIAHHNIPIWLVFLPLALIMLMRWTLEKRARLWIDKRFFREAYSTEQLLSELSMQAGGFTETRPLLDTVTQRISETLHVDKVAVLLRSGNTFRLQTEIGLPADESLMLGENSMAIVEMKGGRKPATIYADRPEEWWLDASASEREALRELGAEILLPLPGRNQLMGLMALGPKRSEEPYSRTDLQLLTSVGTQTGLALENSQLLASLATEAAQRERINREIEIAKEVQERLFPQEFPRVEGVETAGMCRSQQGVGGDYYDCFLLGRGDGSESGSETARKARLGIAIADVSGKGISAALLMAGLRASLRGQTLLEPGDLGAVVENMNTLLFDASAANRYATFFFGAYDPETRELKYVNAGHNPPVVLRRPKAVAGGAAANADGYEVLRLEACGPVVGLLERVEFEQRVLMMERGDLMVAFTDGISEAMDADGEEWGEERMIEMAGQHMDEPVGTLLHVLFDGADAFAGGAAQHDDMTVVLMKLE